MSKRQASCLQCGQQYDQIPDSVTASHIECPKCQGVVEIKIDAPSMEAKSLGEDKRVKERPSRATRVDRAAVKLTRKPTPVVPAAPRKAPPVAPVLPPKPVMKPRVPVAPPKPAPPATPAGPTPEDIAAKKKRAHEIIAKAREKKAKEITPPAEAPFVPPVPKKLSGAELIAELKKKQVGSKTVSRKPSDKGAAANTVAKVRGARPTQKKTTRRSSRRSEEAPKKSPVPMIAGLVLVVGILSGSAYVLTQSGDEEVLGDTASVAETGTSAPGTPIAAGPINLPPAAALLATAEPEGATDEPTPGTTAPVLEIVAAPLPPEIEEPPSPKKVAAPSAEFQVPSPGEAVATRGITDFDALDLTLVPLLSQWSGSSDDDWESVQSKLELFLDDSGVRSTRAGDKMVKMGRHAFPAIVNQMMQVDFSTREGNYTAGVLNDLITKIGQGTNYGWKSFQISTPGSEEFLKDALFNKKIAAKWQTLWVSKFATDDAQWEGFSKNKEETSAQQKEKKPAPIKEEAGEDLFDD